MKLILKNVRFNYVQVWEPKAFMGDEPKYSICLIIPKTDKETIDMLQANIAELKASAGIKSKCKIPVRDGDMDRPDNEAFVGTYFINAKSKIKPWVYNSAKKLIADNSEELYPGCWGMASINLYSYDNTFGKGVSCSLNGIQKLKDGERLKTADNPEDDLLSSDADDSELPF